MESSALDIYASINTPATSKWKGGKMKMCEVKNGEGEVYINEKRKQYEGTSGWSPSRGCFHLE